jgi:hypothetical protein
MGRHPRGAEKFGGPLAGWPAGWPFSNVVFLKILKNPSGPFSKNENFRGF